MSGSIDRVRRSRRRAASASTEHVGQRRAGPDIPRHADPRTDGRSHRRSPRESAARPAHRGEPAALDLDTVRKIWPDLIKKVGTSLGWKLTQVEPIELERPDVLVIAARPGYNSTFDECGTPEAQTKIAQALQRLVHRPVKIKYVRRAPRSRRARKIAAERGKRADSLARDPLVQRVLELFEARPVQMDYDEDDPSSED